jgi:hypothetical protein
MVGIKGWEMPEKCADCALCIDVPQMKGKDLWCCGGLEKSPIIETFYDGVKPDFCPLVEVPDWHDVNYPPPLFGKEVLIYDADTGVHMGFLSQYEGEFIPTHEDALPKETETSGENAE